MLPKPHIFDKRWWQYRINTILNKEIANLKDYSGKTRSVFKTCFFNHLQSKLRETNLKKMTMKKSHNLDERSWHRKSEDVPCREHRTGPGAGTQLGRSMGGLSTNVAIPFLGQNLTSGWKTSGSATAMKSQSLCVTIDVTMTLTYKEES